MSKRAMIAMSGGVDSSVAALLMQQAGYDCVGATLKLFHNDDILAKQSSCCSLQDVTDARLVCRLLNIYHYVFNFSDVFHKQVIDRFIDSYLSGNTPNPCIECNRYVKFDKLILRLNEMELQKLATGHYARVQKDSVGRYLLKSALDGSKDQSYMLYILNQKQLSQIAFPLGEMHKSQVREIAQQNGFTNARKKDSQDICFVPDGNYAGFIEAFSGSKCPCGNFVLQNGVVAGKHKGIIHYTIGQRKHLGIAMGKPVFVCSKSAKDNTVTIGDETDLYYNVVDANHINLIAVDSLEHPLRVTAKLRYRQKAQPAVAVQTKQNQFRVVFDEPQRAPAPGQAVVLYDGDIVIGGGVISSFCNLPKNTM